MTEIKELERKNYRIETLERVYELHVRAISERNLEQALRSALSHTETVSRRIGIPLKHRGVIKILFNEIEYGGLYDPGRDEILIHPDSPLESTLFHELVHYFYPDLFDFPRLGGYLREGLPVYFEKQFYPESWSDIQLLHDRINREYPVYSVGYFLFNSFFNDMVKAIKSEHPCGYIIEILPDIADFERQKLKEHLSDYTVCFTGDRDGSMGILYSWNLKCPYLIHYQKKDSPAQLALSVSREEEWADLVKLMEPHGERIKQEYRYFAAYERSPYEKRQRN